jgi:hypothetical protein
MECVVIGSVNDIRRVVTLLVVIGSVNDIRRVVTLLNNKLQRQ